MLTVMQRNALVVGGSLLVGGAAALITKKAMAAKAQGPVTGPQQAPGVLMYFAPAGTFDPGSTYLVAGPIPTGMDKSTFAQSLAVNGLWTNISVDYYGEASGMYQGGSQQIPGWPPEMPYPRVGTDLSKMYVYGGSYGGSSSVSIDPATSVTAYRFATPTAIAGSMGSTTYKGLLISTITVGPLVYGMVTCPQNVATMLSLMGGQKLAGMQGAIGSSVQEVVGKLSAWIDTYCSG